MRLKLNFRVLALAGSLCLVYAAVLLSAAEARDLQAFWYASRNVLAGNSVYAIPPELPQYIYPPILAVLLAPIPTLNSMWFIWGAATVICFFIALKIILTHTLTEPADSRASSVIILLNLVHLVIIDHLVWGQIQIFMLLGMLISWKYLKSKPIVSGFILGFVSAIKIFPILFALIMLTRGHKKAFFYTLISGIFFTVFGFFVAGWDNIWYFLSDVPVITKNLASMQFYDNISLSSSLIYNNITSLVIAQYIHILFRILCGMIFIYILIKNVYTIDEIFSLILTLIIIISPFAWSHYLILLYFPVNYAIKTKSIHKYVLIWIYSITNMYIFMNISIYYKTLSIAGPIHFACAFTVLGLYFLQARAIIWRRELSIQPNALEVQAAVENLQLD